MHRSASQLCLSEKLQSMHCGCQAHDVASHDAAAPHLANSVHAHFCIGAFLAGALAEKAHHELQAHALTIILHAGGHTVGRGGRH